MSKRNSFYTNKIIRRNSFYIIAFIIFTGLFTYIIAIQFRIYNDYKNKIPPLQQELIELARKKEIIFSFNADETDRLISTLNTLLPNTEDYFSIINSLNILSQETNFTIGSYVLSVQDGQEGKVNLLIEGTGSTSEFEKFIDFYHYKSGRFLTIDRIEYSLTSAKANISLNFYSKRISIPDSASLSSVNQKTLSTVKKINQDLEALSTTSADESQVSTDYSVKEDPFGVR